MRKSSDNKSFLNQDCTTCQKFSTGHHRLTSLSPRGFSPPVLTCWGLFSLHIMKHQHVAHLVPVGHRSEPVLEAVAKLVAPLEAAGQIRTEVVYKGQMLLADWTSDDDGISLANVWAGPVEIWHSCIATDFVCDAIVTACCNHSDKLKQEKKACAKSRTY